jgi:hypothetical protein
VAVEQGAQAGHFLVAHFQLAGQAAQAALALHPQSQAHQYFMQAEAVELVIQEVLPQARAAMVGAEQAVKQIAQTPHLGL